MKCIDQMPVPMDSAPPISHSSGARLNGSRNRPASSSVTCEAITATQ